MKHIINFIKQRFQHTCFSKTFPKFLRTVCLQNTSEKRTLTKVSSPISRFNRHTSVLTKTRNEPKRPETSRNEPKPSEQHLKNSETTRIDPKFQNCVNLEFFSSFCFSNFEPNSQMQAFWAKKYQPAPYFQSADFRSVIFFPKMQSKNLQIWAFKVKKYQLSNLNETSHVLYVEGGDLKSDISFQKF